MTRNRRSSSAGNPFLGSDLHGEDLHGETGSVFHPVRRLSFRFIRADPSTRWFRSVGCGRNAHWTATVYPGPRGNWVFNASTIYWLMGLSRPPGFVAPFAHDGRPHGPDKRLQRITANFLKKCGISPII